MREMTEAGGHRRDQIIAAAMVDVATELRLTDPSELIVMIRGEQAANIADLVNSSGELFFRGGALRYALSAGCDVQWDTTPVVRLDMEFHYAAVSAFFKLTIGRKRAGIEVVEVLVDGEDDLDDDQGRTAARRGGGGAVAAAQAWSKAGGVILGRL
jgi:hypothetical protein